MEWIKKSLRLLDPASVVLETFTGGKFHKAFGVPDEEFERIRKDLAIE